MSRTATRMAVIPGALMERLRRPSRRRPAEVKRVLVAHHLRLGGTIMLTPLIAKLRFTYPAAEIVMTAPRAIAPLYSTRPYGVRALPFDPRDLATLAPILEGGGYDLAIVPGDNRHSWLAMAAGSGWIVAHADNRPGWKNWFVDAAVRFPDAPGAWGDMVAELVPGLAPPPFRPTDWPDPDCAAFDLPSTSRYAVLHVGASTMLKLWEPAKWGELAAYLDDRRLTPVLLAEPGEEGIVERIDPQKRLARYAGTLRPEQVWRLLRGARLLVAPDTGVSHLGRVVGVPTVTLFGPGSATAFGPGRFWRTIPFRAVTIPEFECRDRSVLFGRRLEWLRHCDRSTLECPSPRCMQALDVAMVRQAIESLVGAAAAP